VSKSGCDGVGRIRWLGMMDESLSNQKREREVRSLPLLVMDYGPCQARRDEKERVEGKGGGEVRRFD
jgi:hypothetical protein